MPTLSLYGQFPMNALGGDAGGESPIDFLTDTIKVALIANNTYTPDQDAHDFFDDVSNEVSGGNGYTSGGYTLANKAVTYTGASNKTVWDNTVDPSWTASGAGFTARQCVFYKDSGSAATSPLIGYMNFGSDIVLASGDTLTITLDATNGIFYATVA